MQTAIWLENQQLSIRTDVPIPEPEPGEALIRIIQAGICNTDLELCKGYYPYSGVLGHEFVGIVERIIPAAEDNNNNDDGSLALIGKRVCGDINASCGVCDDCTIKNNMHHCRNRTVLGIVNHHGCFTQYVTLPIRNLYVVPDCISNDFATFVEPLAAALEIQEQVIITPKDRVLIVGDGKLGQLVAQATNLTGCHLLVVGKHPEKLATLQKLWIATCTLEEASSVIQPNSYDIVIECTGNTSGFTMSLQAVRPRGTLILKSTYSGLLSVDASTIVVNEITIIGSRCGPFQKAINLLEKNTSVCAKNNVDDGKDGNVPQVKLDISSLIHGRYQLQDGIAAFQHAQMKGTMKILLQMP